MYIQCKTAHICFKWPSYARIESTKKSLQIKRLPNNFDVVLPLLKTYIFPISVDRAWSDNWISCLTSLYR